MPHFYKEIGGRIQKLREQKGYTHEELAAMINVDRDLLIEFEAGRKRVFVDQLSNLARVLGVTTEYLIYGKKDTGQ